MFKFLKPKQMKPMMNETILTEFYDYHESISNSLIKHVEKIFAAFSQQRGIYDRVRFIDRQGQELLRINNRGGQVSITPQNELQNKKISRPIRA